MQILQKPMRKVAKQIVSESKYAQRQEKTIAKLLKHSHVTNGQLIRKSDEIKFSNLKKMPSIMYRSIFLMSQEKSPKHNVAVQTFLLGDSIN